MDITGMDITILVASTTGIILMSFAFPALGLTGDEATTSEVPSFDIETDRFDMVGDFPTIPSGPSDGSIECVGDPTTSACQNDNDFWLSGGSGGGQFLFIIFAGPSTETNPVVEVGMQDWDNDNVTEESNATLSEVGDTATLTTTMDTDWTVYAELTRLYESGENETTMTVQYEVEHEANTDSAWYSGIPIIGEAAEGIEYVAKTIVYLANVFRWFVLTLVEGMWNMAFALIETVTFAFELSSFLVGTYGEITTASGLAGWAQVILLIPGILFMIEWTKVAVVFIDMIWIG